MYSGIAVVTQPSDATPSPQPFQMLVPCLVSVRKIFLKSRRRTHYSTS